MHVTAHIVSPLAPRTLCTHIGAPAATPARAWGRAWGPWGHAMDYYVVLGVSHTVSQADICRAYKQLSRQLHPDKGGST